MEIRKMLFVFVIFSLLFLRFYMKMKSLSDSFEFGIRYHSMNKMSTANIPAGQN